MAAYRTLLKLVVLITLTFGTKLSYGQNLQEFLMSLKSGLQCSQLQIIFDNLQVNHVSEKKFNDKIKKRIFENYLKSVDGSKTLLLKSDIDKIKKNIYKVYEGLEKNKCTTLGEIKTLVTARIIENYESAKKLLGDNYKFNDQVKFTTDPDKREYFKDIKDKNNFLESYLQFQMSNYLLSDTKIKKAKSLLLKRYKLMVKRQSEKTPSELYADFAKAFASSLDPHTSYMSRQDWEDFSIEMNLSLEGIGATLSSQDGFTVVESVVKGGAADKAKNILPKDKIIAVAQDTKSPVNVIDMELKNVVRLIRGKKGTKVVLTILRKEGEDTVTVKAPIIRDKINLKDQAAKLEIIEKERDGKKLKLAVLDLPSFYQGNKKGTSSIDDVKRLLKEANDKKVDGLVFNLSMNGGGILEGARQIGGMFIKRGAIVATKDENGKVNVLSDENSEIEFSKPVVILISRLSASASEIVAGALKDYDRALIVGGDHTFGKGTVQQLRPLPHNLGVIKVTTSMFYIPSGHSTQHSGVESDITIPSIFNNPEIGEKSADNSLPPSKIKKFLGNEANFTDKDKQWKPITSKVIKALTKKSKERVKNSDKFKEILKEIDETEKARNKSEVLLADLVTRAKKDKEKEAKLKTKKGKNKDDYVSAVEKRNDTNKPYLDEATNILADLVVELK